MLSLFIIMLCYFLSQLALGPPQVLFSRKTIAYWPMILIRSFCNVLALFHHSICKKFPVEPIIVSVVSLFILPSLPCLLQPVSPPLFIRISCSLLLPLAGAVLPPVSAVSPLHLEEFARELASLSVRSRPPMSSRVSNLASG